MDVGGEGCRMRPQDRWRVVENEVARSTARTGEIGDEDWRVILSREEREEIESDKERRNEIKSESDRERRQREKMEREIFMENEREKRNKIIVRTELEMTQPKIGFQPNEPKQ